MSLADDFKRSHSSDKVNDSVLKVSNGYFSCVYDFTQRVVYTGEGVLTPFSQLDREVLILMRDRLVEL